MLPPSGIYLPHRKRLGVRPAEEGVRVEVRRQERCPEVCGGGGGTGGVLQQTHDRAARHVARVAND
eukprot:3718-Eustigmatos_ZCMA.PRE.1